MPRRYNKAYLLGLDDRLGLTHRERSSAAEFVFRLNDMDALTYCIKDPAKFLWRTGLTLEELRAGVANGSIKDSWLVYQSGDGAEAAIPVGRFLEVPDSLPQGNVGERKRVHTSDQADPIVSNDLSEFLRRQRRRTGYAFLRGFNNLMFSIACGLIVLSGIAVFFFSDSLPFVLGTLIAMVASFLALVVLRGSIEMAIDVADCIAEQTRMFSLARQRKTESTAAPSPTP
jgi:hypothetical protein